MNIIESKLSVTARKIAEKRYFKNGYGQGRLLANSGRDDFRVAHPYGQAEIQVGPPTRDSGWKPKVS